jgi:hypothetical protein
MTSLKRTAPDSPATKEDEPSSEKKAKPEDLSSRVVIVLVNQREDREGISYHEMTLRKWRTFCDPDDDKNINCSNVKFKRDKCYYYLKSKDAITVAQAFSAPALAFELHIDDDDDV